MKPYLGRPLRQMTTVPYSGWEDPTCPHFIPKFTILVIMKFSGNSPCISHQVFVTALCAALACIKDTSAAQDDRDGFYAGLQLGVADPNNGTVGPYLRQQPLRAVTCCCIHPR